MIKKGMIILYFLLSLLFLSGCNLQTTTLLTEVIQIDYLNQTPPTNESIRFEPEGYLASDIWFWHGTPVFSPEGNEMFWTKYIRESSEIQMWSSKKVNGIWLEPTKFEIDGIEGAYNCPVFVDDKLYFLNVNGLDFTIYQVTFVNSEWGNPIALDLNLPEGKALGWNFSMADNKNIYFSLWNVDGTESSKIYRCVYSNGAYQEIEELSVLNTEQSGSGGLSFLQMKVISFLILFEVQDLDNMICILVLKRNQAIFLLLKI
ncbi:MAG: hypothetical protein KJ971_02725 [Firmicutes bacterium]|nr:hypothetical protein [Bacillota bacterium]